MRFGLTAYPQKPLIMAHSGVSRGTRSLKVVWSLLELSYFVNVRGESAYMQARRSLRHTPM